MALPKLVREPILAGVKKLGYEVYKVNREGALYGQIAPHSNYSPWNKDRNFSACYESIKDHTLVDIYRCYELWSLVEKVRLLDGGLIEVGVWRGGTGAMMARRAMMCGITDPVYLCDTFEGVVKASGSDPSYVGGEHADTSEQIVAQLVQRMALPQVKILKGIFPDQTAGSLTASTFRLCHIDVDVYQSAKDVYDWIWAKLVVGGVVVFDDYGFDSTPGVTRFVEEQAQLPGRMTIHNLNGHAVVVKTS